MSATPVSERAEAVGRGREREAQAATAVAGVRLSPSRTAVLLIDLQVDFLDSENGKMPVSRECAVRVIGAANRVLAGKALAGAVPVLIVNQFPGTATLRNIFRRGAAIAGSPGSRLDPRIAATSSIPVFSKQQASAFSNPELRRYLRSEDVTTIWLVGVMSEGCVRATALTARELGFKVAVAEEGIATNAPWKARLAAWLLRRGGVTLVAAIPDATRA